MSSEARQDMEAVTGTVGDHSPEATKEPQVWVLLGKGAGGNAQMIALAEALGWPYETKHLVYNPLNRCPNLLLGRSLASLRRSRSSPLQPPWPDLVIAASRRSAPVAQWIKQRSAGRTRLVHLLHAQAPLHRFDLIITLPQYRLPVCANVLHLNGPLNVIDTQRLEQARSHWSPRLQHLPRPWIALLVGGNSSTYRLDTATAQRLGQEASRSVRRAGGSLLLTTSPRTPQRAAQALFNAVDCQAFCYTWRPEDPDNPYHGFLSLADRFIVTGDSASLAIEACATGKPVAVFHWQPRRRRRIGNGSLLGARPSRWGQHLFEALVYWGLIKPARDFTAYHRLLDERGLITPLDQNPVPAARQPLDDMACAVAGIRRLMRCGCVTAGQGVERIRPGR